MLSEREKKKKGRQEDEKSCMYKQKTPMRGHVNQRDATK